MKHLKLLFALCAPLTLQAQSPFQLAYDSVFLNSTMGHQVVRATDGSIFLHETGDDQPALSKTDANGHMLWRRRMNAIWYGDPDMYATADGGIMYVNWGYHPGLFPDSSYNLIDLMKVQQDGSVLWAEQIGYDEGSNNYPWQLAFIEDGLGAYYVTLSNFGPGNNITLKIASNGSVIWSRHWPHWMQDMVADGSGGLFFVSADLDQASYCVGHLAGDGSVQWIKQYLYAAPDKPIYPGGIKRDAQGNLFIAGYHSPLAGQYSWMVAKLTTDGQLIWDRLFTNVIGNTPAPEFLDIGGGEFLLMEVNQGRAMVIDTTGAYVSGFIINNDLGSQHTQISDCDFDASGLLLTGRLSTTDQFGVTQSKPIVWNMDLNNLNICSAIGLNVTTTDLPQSLFTVTDVTGLTTYPTWSMPVALTTEPLQVFADMPYCDLVGIEQPAVPRSPLALDRTLLPQGTSITLTGQASADVEIFDVNGKHLLVQQISANAHETITGSDALASGFYLLRATDQQGRVIASMKFAVE